jgi:hypothetical protein
MSNNPNEFETPTALLAALPAVLGFLPEKSLMVVCVEQRRLGAVLRVDLAETPITHVGMIAASTAAAGADQAILVIVDADEALCPRCNEEHRRLADALTGALGAHAITVTGLYTVDAMDAAGTWTCLEGPERGTHGKLDDPQYSPMAVAAVLDGRRLYGRREELQEVIAVADPGRTAMLAAVIDRFRADPAAENTRMDAPAVFALMRAGADLDDTQIANLVCSLTDGTVRDAP